MARTPAKAASDRTAAGPLSAAARLVVLHGKDRFLQDEHLRVLREALAKAHGADGFDTVRFDGQQGPRIIADVLDECRSFGLMQQHKIVLVDNADLLLKEVEDEAPPPRSPPPPKPVGKKGGARMPASMTPREILEGYAEDPSSSATLVLKAGTWRPGNLDKKIAALPGGQGAVIKCEAPTFEEAAAWAVKRCKARHHSTIDPAAARTLVDTTGVDLGRIDSELEKLALAAGGDGSPITPELVELMVGMTRQDEFFNIQGSLLSGELSRALRHLRELIEVSRQDPVPVGWAYIEAARKLHLAARAVREGRNVFSLQYQLKAFGPGAQEMLANLAKITKTVSPGAAARLLNQTVKVDAGNKSGLGEAVRNLEVMAVKFAGMGKA
jgi:DNA polymerase III delta subunit